MFKLIKETNVPQYVIRMSEMEPLQIARVQSHSLYDGRIVMRTASKEKFEVMDLSAPGADSCWMGKPQVMVSPLPPGSKITFEVV